MELMGRHQGPQDTVVQEHERPAGPDAAAADGLPERTERPQGLGPHHRSELPRDEGPGGVRRGGPQGHRLPAERGEQVRHQGRALLRGQLEVPRGRGPDAGLERHRAGEGDPGARLPPRGRGLQPRQPGTGGEGVHRAETQLVLHGRGGEGHLQGLREDLGEQEERVQWQSVQGGSHHPGVEPHQRAQVRVLAGRGLRGEAPGLDRVRVGVREGAGPQPPGDRGRGGVLVCCQSERVRQPHLVGQGNGPGL
mmetsp:Transcript_9690/g.27612  ORF Transcript_9690/g.27612 Transcript_9690/m.27612 type:complete len:251 (-) Transcript_9690:62-814(-)